MEKFLFGALAGVALALVGSALLKHDNRRLVDENERLSNYLNPKEEPKNG